MYRVYPIRLLGVQTIDISLQLLSHRCLVSGRTGNGRDIVTAIPVPQAEPVRLDGQVGGGGTFRRQQFHWEAPYLEVQTGHGSARVRLLDVFCLYILVRSQHMILAR